MSFLYKGREILTDNEGFLKNLSDWDEDMMSFMAEADGQDLTEAHIYVICAVRKYYEEFATTPPMRGLIAYLKKSDHPDLAKSVALARLFPDGAAKTAARYAGLPKPVKCI
ncbi:MAG: TusE/DsrC/DsvC family sulfur relay protein [Succinivibrio sp.]|nr:TusE/DsrC/DsvC family sulfur relay protein [Succinivibrio sp.]